MLYRLALLIITAKNNMVVFVEYSMSKEFFIRHKKKIRKILRPLEFDACVLKFEREMNCRKIAQKMDLTLWIVRRLLSLSCEQIRKSGLKK